MSYENIKKLKVLKFSFFKKSLTDETLLFKASVILKLIFITVFTTLILSGLCYLFLEVNLIFFEANGYPEKKEFESLFYHYILSSLFDILPYYLIFLFFLVGLGFYIANLLLRPFRMIVDYCSNFIENKDSNYDPDFYSDLKLLTHFSEYFFNIIESAKKNNALLFVSIPSKYTKIHRPVFEKNFFIQFFLLISIVSLLASISLHFVFHEIYSKIEVLAHSSLSSHSATDFFIGRQTEIFENLNFFIISIYFCAHVFLCFHFYGKVAGPAFAIFSTMRSFLKGNYESKIHLVGHYFLRNYCRKINQYLTYIQKNIPQNRK